MNVLLLRGDPLAGYSYFDYDQMTLLGIEVHSDELELLQQTADMYDWEIMETEVEPKFKEAALSDRLGQSPIQLSLQTDSLSADEDRAFILPYERTFQDEESEERQWLIGRMNQLEEHKAERMEILRLLHEKQISATEAIERLRAYLKA